MVENRNIDNDGDWEVNRGLYVPVLNSTEDVDRIVDAVANMDGVIHVAADVTGHNLTVRYDLRKRRLDDVVGILVKLGYPPKESWWFRIRRSWYRFTESNMSDYAKAPISACCNKPPGHTKH